MTALNFGSSKLRLESVEAKIKRFNNEISRDIEFYLVLGQNSHGLPIPAVIGYIPISAEHSPHN